MAAKSAPPTSARSAAKVSFEPTVLKNSIYLRVKALDQNFVLPAVRFDALTGRYYHLSACILKIRAFSSSPEFFTHNQPKWLICCIAADDRFQNSLINALILSG